jgi:hypothetical protein
MTQLGADVAKPTAEEDEEKRRAQEEARALETGATTSAHFFDTEELVRKLGSLLEEHASASSANRR